MARFVTIGYGDRAGYDRTDPAIRDAAQTAQYEPYLSEREGSTKPLLLPRDCERPTGAALAPAMDENE